jgi:hypothetical protein
MNHQSVLKRQVVLAIGLIVSFFNSPAQAGTNMTALEIYPAIELVFPTQLGATYQLQYSVNLTDWTNTGEPLQGIGLKLYQLVSTRDKQHAYYRFVTMPSAERPTQKEFKGVELYSWPGPDGTWLFSLVIGTNRLKTEAEVKEPANQISGVQELEQHFLRLAIDENVCWCHLSIGTFAYPDEPMVQEVIAAAQRAKIALLVP